MDTKVFSEKDLENAAKAVLNGEVIAFPTETVFGLGVIYDSSLAFEKLVEVKERRADKPFTLMLSSPHQIAKFAVLISKTKALIDAFFPGEVTLLLPPQKGLPTHVTMGSSFIGIRVPSHTLTLKFLTLVGKPLLVPSANKRDQKPALNTQEVLNVFDGQIYGVIDGETTSHIPSTIVQVDDTITLVREGSVPFAKIKKVWEEAL